MTQLEVFIGSWELDPSKNNYQTPFAPLQGSYIISQIDSDTLQFDMAWTDADGNQQTAQYTSVVDGKKYPIEERDLEKFIQTELLEAGVMESRTYINDRVTTRGLRQIINGGARMLITQETILPNGETITNMSIYDKK